MSRKRIKCLSNRKKRHRVPPISGRHLELAALMSRRAELRRKDADVIGDMIADDKLDPYKVEDYKYVNTVAKSLGWSVSRVFRAIEKAEVGRKVKEEKDERKSKSSASRVLHKGRTGEHEGDKGSPEGKTRDTGEKDESESN